MPYRTFILFLIVSTATADSSSDAAEFVKNKSLSFSKKLTENLLIGRKDNFVYSPAGAYIISSLVALGAGGNSAAELQQVLGYSPKEYLLGLKEYYQQLNVYSVNVSANVGNAIFMSNSYKAKNVNQKYENDISKNFNTAIYRVNDVKQEILNMMNWFSKLGNHIKKQFTGDDISDGHKFIFLNTFRFIGKWQTPFPSINYSDKFSYLNGIEKKIPYVINKDVILRTYFNEKFNASFLELPYGLETPGYRMIIIVPGIPQLNTQNDTLFYEIQKNLKNFDYNQLKFVDDDTTLTVAIPKIKFESQLNFKKELKKVNVQEIFNEKANFSGIFQSDKYPKIDQIFQKTSFSINNAGTESGNVPIPRYSPWPDELFVVAKPFFFALLSPSGAVVLEGQVTEPQ